MDSEQQSNVASSHSFRVHSQTSYPQPHYQYPVPTSQFPMDPVMSMEDFARGVQSAANAMRGSGTPPSTATVSHNTPAQATIPSLQTTGMAPPQGGNSQPYSPTGTRPSIDDSMDITMSGGDPKRKRSKVSRACDECRRKKVRCDAAADDGSLKPCSNCTRSGNVCGYNRVPMKRGPSKGYIKELSERVQHVESQMAMSNTPGLPGYRSSLDGSSGIYPDPGYSPDDQLSFKRTFSFSDPRGLFTNPDFNKDRIPSAGGAWTTSSPQVSTFRRDRGSVAIAPDQQSPTLLRNKPFWSNSLSSEDGPPAKRQKIDTGNTVSHITIGKELLDKYYDNVHVNLPILPESDAVTSIVGKAQPNIQHAFYTALNNLPPTISKAVDVVTDTDNSHPTSSISSENLPTFMWDAARENPSKRSKEDNLVHLWIYLLMAVEAESDLLRFRDGAFPRATMIKHTIDLGWRCIELENENFTSGTMLASGSDSNYINHLARAWYATSTLARLHALSVGSQDPIPSLDDTPLPVPQAVLPPSHLHSAQTSIILATIIEIALGNFDPNIFIRPNKRLRKTVHTLIRWGLATTDIDEKHEAKIRTFLDLLTSRHALLLGVADILVPTVTMVGHLTNEVTTSSEQHMNSKQLYDPMTMHYYVLTAITLLEFIQQGLNNTLAKEAFKSLQDLKGTLKTVASQTGGVGKLQNGSQEKPVDGHVESGGKANEQAAGNHDNEETHVGLHWANVLLNLIDRQIEALGPDVDVTTQTDGRSENTTEGVGAGTVVNNDGSTISREENPVAVDFSMLLRHGYMNVLTAFAGL